MCPRSIWTTFLDCSIRTRTNNLAIKASKLIKMELYHKSDKEAENNSIRIQDKPSRTPQTLQRLPLASCSVGNQIPTVLQFGITNRHLMLSLVLDPWAQQHIQKDLWIRCKQGEGMDLGKLTTTMLHHILILRLHPSWREELFLMEHQQSIATSRIWRNSKSNSCKEHRIKSKMFTTSWEISKEWKKKFWI